MTSTPWWLVVEDDEIDVATIERGLRQLGHSIDLAIVSDGANVPERLREHRAARGGRAPALMLLDINLPLGTGHEVLDQLAETPEATGIPRVVLTTSDREDDVRESYARGAAGHFVKAHRFDDFVQTLSRIVAYWETARRVDAD